jgi:glyoxylase-like metal-dependent hydrolase (beta-lactamase superfamily II)/rhodanese-related sulfurtransferase
MNGMQKVNVNTLREWLAEGKPLTVLDVRSEEDRAQWSIPGSLYIDAYHALKDGRPDALDGVVVPRDRPIVTVCNRGKVSQIAAELLRAQGFEALSLEGGMQAWSLAWNVAEVRIPASGARLLQVRRTGKGCLSYILGSSGSAVVIDASLEPSVYIRWAESQGWRIRYVLDTHVHADHVSRSRALSEETGAALLMPAQRRVQFDFQPLSDRDVVQIGSVQLSVLRTPGHTEESTCYLLNNTCLFTGDTLFLGAVGRPDLHASEQEARAHALALFKSFGRIRSLPSHLLVLPGHASEPIAFDGTPLIASLGNVFSRLSGWLVSEGAFVNRLMARLPPTPANYLQIVEINERGTADGVDVTELEAGANRCAVA